MGRGACDALAAVGNSAAEACLEFGQTIGTTTAVWRTAVWRKGRKAVRSRGSQRLDGVGSTDSAGGRVARVEELGERSGSGTGVTRGRGGVSWLAGSR